MEILKKGSKGEAVVELQKLLKIEADGVFGSKTETAVVKYQLNHGLKADGVVGEATMNKLKGVKEPNGIVKSTRKITKIIIHCADTPEDRHFTVEDIRGWHKQRGFNDIGYHYVIYLDGTVHLGRNVNLIGAHCTGHNANSIGICYIGGKSRTDGKPKDTRNPLQDLAFRVLLKELRKHYPNATIHGHNEFANKACPCFNVKKAYGDI